MKIIPVNDSICIVKDCNDLNKIYNELKNNDSLSLYEFLEYNTLPLQGTWKMWYDKFFNEWLKSNNNTLNGKMFYEWLLINYCN